MPGALPPEEEIRSKGFTLLSALEYLEQAWGAAARAQVVGECAAEHRAVLEGRILPGSWYPFAIQVGLYEAADRLLGRGDLALCREIGKFTSSYEMKRIHKAFLKVAGLDLWVRTAGLMWGRYYSTGRLEVEEIGRDSGTVRVTRFNPISQAFCHDFAGWLHRTVEIAGFHDVAIDHRSCLLDGAEACRYVGSWEK